MEKAFEAKDKISVIVKVDNDEKYIERCLDTITNQTYKNIEIILVDLFSTDNSYNIIEKYCKKDDRIKVLKYNMETSLSLTDAVKKSSGEYITMVRVEDYIEKNYLIDMYKLLSEETNIVVSNFVTYKEKDGLFYFENIKSDFNIINKYEINNIKNSSKYNKFVLESIFGKLYKTSLIKSFGYLTLKEEEVMKWLYCKTINIGICNKNNYIYRIYNERLQKLLTVINNKEEDLISIIIPVYNVEDYLEECLNSVINQTYKNLEIILVNDGSTDGSLSICETYAKKDERIKLITKENGGASSSRNYGLEVAKGEFVYFIDSDDWIDLDTIQLLYSQQKIHNSDIVFGNYFNYREYIGSFGYYILDDEFVIKRLTAIESLINQSASEYNTASFIIVPNKLMKKRLFENIKFLEGKIFEDEAIMHKLFMHANSSLLININNYVYRIRNNSVMTSSFNIKNVETLLEIIDEKLSEFALFTRGENMIDVVNRSYLLLKDYKEMMEYHNYKNHDLYLRIKNKMKLFELGNFNKN